MPSEPRWLTPDEIIELNALIVADTGEPHLVRDRGLLESACGKPPNRWHYDGVRGLGTLACSLLFGIARNHPFAQGNKRTGFEAALLFLEANGYEVVLSDREAWAELIIEIIKGDQQEEVFAAVLTMLLQPIGTL